jgi:hypothetical protein
MKGIQTIWVDGGTATSALICRNGSVSRHRMRNESTINSRMATCKERRCRGGSKPVIRFPSHHHVNDLLRILHFGLEYPLYESAWSIKLRLAWRSRLGNRILAPNALTRRDGLGQSRHHCDSQGPISPFIWRPEE